MSARSPLGTWAALVVAALFGVACGDPTSPPDERVLCVTAAGCETRLELVPGRFLRVWETLPLDVPDALVHRAIVVVHGTNRDADAYFQTMVDATTQAGQLERTLVLSPRFMTVDDAPAADEPYWSSGGWKEGDLSSSDGPEPRISSYAALDTIVARLASAARFPRLTEIVVTGHSAGGQVVHRYAAASPIEARVRAGVVVRYVVANPSTWLYLGPERATGSGFAVPADVAAGCPEYDDWHYGLQRRNAYANAETAAELRRRLTEREVIVMVGIADTLTADLDQSCGADLQGRRRYDRGATLIGYLSALFPGHRHRLVVVPGVGHSSRGMYTSAGGQGALFMP